MWLDVAYEPGELKAVVYKEGKVIGEAAVKSAAEPYSIKLTPDRSKIEASGNDLSYVLVEAYDKDGNLCPFADNMINFQISGPGEIAGIGNGNPQSHEPFQVNYQKLFNGKAMFILKSIEKPAGEIEVVATSNGLKPDKISVTTEL